MKTRAPELRAFSRAGDLNPPVLQVFGRLRNRPFGIPDRACGDQKLGHLTGIDPLLPFVAKA